ncbi:MAG: TlpA family protein disulfide reductase [Betaproteobacteria bacterium]|nr:TlpA family protein disulfide reductase [Betaproteobacteria bacterium]
MDARAAVSRPGPAVTRRALLALSAAATGFSATLADTPQPQPWPRNKPQPTLALPTLDGEPWKLTDQARQVVLLNFWASWCEPCRAEMPALQRLSERYVQAGLRVWAVNYREPADTVRRFVTTTGMTLPVLLDADGSVAKSLGIGIFPTTVILDRRGRIRWTVTGDCAWDREPAIRWLRDVLQSA